MKMRSVLAIALLLAAAMFFFMRDRPGALAKHVAATSQTPEEPALDVPTKTPDEATPGGVKRVLAARRRQLLEKIRREQAQHSDRAPEPGAAANEVTPPKGTLVKDVPETTDTSTSHARILTKEYIRAAVGRVIPLVAECYDNELPAERRRAGELMVRFTIEGEPEVGGVVSESSILSGSLANEQAFATCVTETMYTLELEPPEEGGMVVVEYPMHFSPDGDDGAGEPSK